jgi:hypothetical protein
VYRRGSHRLIFFAKIEPMADAEYLRRQAELCRAIADLMSSSSDANLARQAAERYARRAANAEQEQGTATEPPAKPAPAANRGG